jgi:hypothetical protein
MFLSLILVRGCLAVTQHHDNFRKNDTNLLTGLEIEVVQCIGSTVITQAYLSGVLYEL